MNRTLHAVATAGFLALTALTMPSSARAALPIDCQVSYRGNAIETFHSHEAQMLHFDAQVNRTPYGSVKYNEFVRLRQQFANAAAAALQVDLRSYAHIELSGLVDEVEGKLNRSTYGTVIYNAYILARTHALRGFQDKGIENLNCATMTYDRALDGASEYETLLSRSTYGTVRYNSLVVLRDESYRVATERLNQYISYAGIDFRSLDTLGESFDQLIARVTYGTKAYQFYETGRRAIYARALEAARSQVLSFDLRTLQSIERDYDDCVARSTYGTARYTFCTQVRNIVRAEISRKTPRPPVVRCPDPNTVWDARLGRCVARTTPPRPVPPRPVPPRPVPGAPGYCPDPATHWDVRLGRCVR